MKESAVRNDAAAEDAGAAQRRALLADALEGLQRPAKSLPCKWLYDPAGAALFERITRLPEYYPTRTERGILRRSGPAIGAAIGPGAAVVELGPGDGEKAVLLLAALTRPRAYVPVDIAAEWLGAAARRVAGAFPALPVWPVVADFGQVFALPPAAAEGAVLGFFPGSTIGNFAPAEARAFLARLRRTLGPAARLVVGVDLVKEPATLVAAYEDAAGVTAAFNLNLLARLNREAGADFDLGGFRHRAVWNAEQERIEMHLVSIRAQSVRLGGREIRFAEGESIHTENSHKFRMEGFRRLAAEAGWRDLSAWTDEARRFAVWLLAAG